MAGRAVLLGLGGPVEDSGAYAAGIRRWDRIAFLLHYVIAPARRVTANNRWIGAGGDWPHARPRIRRCLTPGPLAARLIVARNAVQRPLRAGPQGRPPPGAPCSPGCYAAGQSHLPSPVGRPLRWRLRCPAERRHRHLSHGPWPGAHPGTSGQGHRRPGLRPGPRPGRVPAHRRRL